MGLPSWHGSDAQSELLEAARAGDPLTSVHALVVAAPPFVHGSPASGALLHSMCMEGRGVEFVYMDPPSPFVPEFVNLVLACKHLRWVGVGHVNLEQHAGWVARSLANLTGWHVVATGEYEFPPVALAVPVPN